MERSSKWTKSAMIVTHIGNNIRNLRTIVGYDECVIGNPMLCIICSDSSHSKKNCLKYRATAATKIRGTYEIGQWNKNTLGKPIFPNGIMKILFVLLIKTKDPSWSWFLNLTFKNFSGKSERKQAEVVQGQYIIQTHDRIKNNVSLTRRKKRGMIAFGGGMKGQIRGICKIGRSDKHSIEKVYHVERLKHKLLSISQLCEKGHKVIFSLTDVKEVNIETQEVVMTGNWDKYPYTINTSRISDENLVCLTVIDKYPLLWHKFLGHASYVQLNKVISNGLDIGLPKIKF